VENEGNVEERPGIVAIRSNVEILPRWLNAREKEISTCQFLAYVRLQPRRRFRERERE